MMSGRLEFVQLRSRPVGQLILSPQQGRELIRFYSTKARGYQTAFPPFLPHILSLGRSHEQADPRTKRAVKDVLQGRRRVSDLSEQHMYSRTHLEHASIVVDDLRKAKD